MKHLYIITAVLLLWWLPQTVQAQQYTGISGLVHIPTAETNHEGDAFIGAHFLNKAITPDTGFLYLGEKYHTFDYYVALTPFSWLEMSYVCTERMRAKDDQTGQIKWSKDRYASVKIQPLKEGKYWPAVAIGGNDVFTTDLGSSSPDVQLYFSNVYIAATKHFTFAGNELGLTVAYRHFFRSYNSKWNGVVGGITFRPSFFPQWRIMAEYTGNEFILGTDVLLWQHLRLQGSVKDFKHFYGGVCLQFNLLGKKYAY